MTPCYYRRCIIRHTEHIFIEIQEILVKLLSTTSQPTSTVYEGIWVNNLHAIFFGKFKHLLSFDIIGRQWNAKGCWNSLSRMITTSPATQSIPWLLMTWRLHEARHLHTWYWPSSLIIHVRVLRVCHLIGAKPLPESIPTYCQLDIHWNLNKDIHLIWPSRTHFAEIWVKIWIL